MIHSTSSFVPPSLSILSAHPTRIDNDQFTKSVAEKNNVDVQAVPDFAHDTRTDTTPIKQEHRSVADVERALQNLAGFLATPQTQFDAQHLAQNSNEPTAREEFMAFMAKSTDEKMFDMMLQRKGLTKEELDALPPEEREKILKEIKEEIEREVKEKAGILESGAEDAS